ncbi:MAG: hypothetical protein NVS4B8_20450 [Herpetosiphon sp.]
MKVLGTIIRWFTLGAITGLLVAPRPGYETRELVGEKFNQLVEGFSSEPMEPQLKGDEGHSHGAVDARSSLL